MLFVIVSGRSGSGKSVALHVLEDLGFYCVDNLPIKLLPQLAELLALQSTSVAVSLDVRNLPATLDLFDNALKLLPSHFKTQVLFLDADHQILIQRYSDTRRRHPLFYRYSSLERAIDEERQLLESLLAQADWVIDTSKTSTHELAALLRTHLLGQHEQQLAVLFESFGFKYGMPLDADYIFDVRFLPNPHWDLKLRALTGLDPAVIAFFEQQTEVRHFIKQTCRYLAQWLPLLEHSNRSYLTVAIGCTGGKHRSVYVAKQLADYFCRSGKNVQVRHKGLERKEPVG